MSMSNCRWIIRFSLPPNNTFLVSTEIHRGNFQLAHQLTAVMCSTEQLPQQQRPPSNCLVLNIKHWIIIFFTVTITNPLYDSPVCLWHHNSQVPWLRSTLMNITTPQFCLSSVSLLYCFQQALYLDLQYKCLHLFHISTRWSQEKI